MYKPINKQTHHQDSESNLLFSKTQRFIDQHCLIKAKSTIICGFSGGPDSLFLLIFLARLAQNGLIALIAAHLDHEWQLDSDKTAQFCIDAANRMGIKIITQKLSELPHTLTHKNGSLENMGRIARKLFFDSLYQKFNADAVALGHHLQDQQETFFIRLIRGSSLTGLTVMKARSGHVIRPLLELHKADIVEYLVRNNIKFIHDKTNDSDSFLRNRLRKYVIPALRSCDNRFDTNFLKTITRLQEGDEAITAVAKRFLNQKSVVIDNQAWLPISTLLDQPINLQHCILINYLIANKAQFNPSNRFLQEILHFLQCNKSRSHQLSDDWLLSKLNGLVAIHKRISC